MKTEIKQQLHQLVDRCENEDLLEEAKSLLEAGNKEEDWWHDLRETDKSLVMESEAQYNKGDFVNHQELMKRFEEWKKK